MKEFVTPVTMVLTLVGILSVVVGGCLVVTILRAVVEAVLLPWKNLLTCPSRARMMICTIEKNKWKTQSRQRLQQLSWWWPWLAFPWQLGRQHAWSWPSEDGQDGRPKRSWRGRPAAGWWSAQSRRTKTIWTKWSKLQVF